MGKLVALTRKQILRDRLEIASHNLYCCSANYLMTIPKEGQEEEYRRTAAEVEMLKAWLKEFHRTNIDSTIEFVGHINGWSSSCTSDGRRIVDHLHFEVDTGADYLYGDRRIFGVGSEVMDWFVGKDGKCGMYDIEKDRRNSRLVKITVDTIEHVRAIEWVVDEDAEGGVSDV